MCIWEMYECTAEPTLLCTLLDIADNAEANTRQATDLTDASAIVFQLLDDAIALFLLIMLKGGDTGAAHEFRQILTQLLIAYTLFHLVVEIKDVECLG